jgi:hypothetical protein
MCRVIGNCELFVADDLAVLLFDFFNGSRVHNLDANRVVWLSLDWLVLAIRPHVNNSGCTTCTSKSRSATTIR